MLLLSSLLSMSSSQQFRVLHFFLYDHIEVCGVFFLLTSVSVPFYYKIVAGFNKFTLPVYLEKGKDQQKKTTATKTHLSSPFFSWLLSQEKLNHS